MVHNTPHPGGRPTARGRLAGLLLATALLTLPSSAVASTTTDPWVPIAATDQLSYRVLTPGSGSGHYDATKADVLTVRAANQFDNEREVYWPSGQTPMLNGQVCATWASATADTSQEGLALRIVAEPGRTRAVTVTKNVWAGAYWTINVHTWDTGRAAVFQQIGQVQLGPVLWDYATNKPLPWPWRVCARVVDQALLLVVWRPGVEAPPRWDDQSHGLVVALPAEFTLPGRMGWYAGHLEAGGSLTYGDLGVWRYAG